jgi:hypothetical protein
MGWGVMHQRRPALVARELSAVPDHHPSPLTLSAAAPGISAAPSEENLRYFNVMILGPQQSPYEGEASLKGTRKNPGGMRALRSAEPMPMLYASRRHLQAGALSA